MGNIADILKTVLPVFLALGLGMLCRAKRLLTDEGAATLKKVVVNITLPAVSLRAFAQADYAPRNLLVPVWIFGCCLLALALGRLAARYLKAPGRLFPFLCTGFEGGMLGFALYPMLYGSAAPFAIVDMGQVFFVFTVYKMLLSRGLGAGAVLREAAASPTLWALVLGVALGASGLYGAVEPSAKGVLDASLDFLAAPTGFLILLSVGYDLRPREIQWRRTLSVVITRVVIMGALLSATLFVNGPLFGGAVERGAAVLLFALPAPFVLPVFADDIGERAFLSSALSVMTALAVVVFVILLIALR